MTRLRALPSRRPTLVVALALLALTSTACSGPRAPLGVGIRELPSDVVLGNGRVAPGVPVAVPVPPVALPLTPLAPVPELRLPEGPATDDGPQPAQGPIAAPPAPPPAAAACPKADPRTAPPDEARNTIAAPPAAGTYSFRSSGGFEGTGADADRGRFPETSLRTVKNVVRVSRATETWYRFDVEAVLGRLVTTTTYTVVPETQAPLSAAAAGPGLYLSRLVSRLGDQQTQNFRPANDPGLLMLPFPAVPGDTFSAAGTDPQTGVTISYTGEVGKKVRVEACRVPLDAFPVHLDGKFGSGGTVEPGAAETFTADYAFGTAYGGLSLEDRVVMDRTALGGNYHQELAATIDRRPAPATTQGVPECSGSCAP